MVLGGMAADVSCLVRLISGGDATEPAKPTAPITRDLLAGCITLDSKELDLDLQVPCGWEKRLDLQVPCGWEKRLDLKSGKVYLQRCNSSTSSSSTTDKNTAPAKFQDLNFPPSASRRTLNLFDDGGLHSKPDSSSPYQSVCTLDKVKSALARAEKETGMRKRSSTSMSTTSSSSLPSKSSSSIRDGDLDPPEQPCASVAAGCPSCLLYVLISRSHPRCPRCNTTLPLPPAAKKPRIDLNMSI